MQRTDTDDIKLDRFQVDANQHTAKLTVPVHVGTEVVKGYVNEDFSLDPDLGQSLAEIADPDIEHKARRELSRLYPGMIHVIRYSVIS